MIPTRQKYHFPKSDIARITGLGYTISPESSITFDAFINQYFANFNLVKLLDVVEYQLSKTTKRQIYRTISYNDREGTISIKFGIEYHDSKDDLCFERKLKSTGTKIDIWHDYCIIPLAFRGKHLTQPIFQESIRQYINMGADHIFILAALSDGGYTWARYGFVAEQKAEVDVILAAAKNTLAASEFAMIKTVYDAYYTANPAGNSFPIDLWASFDFMKQIMRGKSWHGRLDLKDPEQLETFCDYVFR